MDLLNNVIPFSLIVWGRQHIASGVASILNAKTPLFTVLVAHDPNWRATGVRNANAAARSVYCREGDGPHCSPKRPPRARRRITAFFGRNAVRNPFMKPR